MENIGVRIKEEREKQKKSARSLASAVGVSPSAVTMWENGQTKNLRPRHLLAVADHLGVSIRWLITGRAHKDHGVNAVAEEPALYSRAPLSPDGIEVCQQWEKLPREAREQVRQYIYLLAILASADSNLTLKNLPKKFSEFEKIISRSLLHKKSPKAA